jgi:hypothetical protein
MHSERDEEDACRSTTFGGDSPVLPQQWRPRRVCQNEQTTARGVGRYFLLRTMSQSVVPCCEENSVGR